MQTTMDRLSFLKSRAGECCCFAVFLSHAARDIGGLEKDARQIGLSVCLEHLAQDLDLLHQSAELLEEDLEKTCGGDA